MLIPLLTVLLATALAAQDATTYDLVLRGGTLVDGAARKAFVADIAIADGRIAAIAAIGEIETAPGTPIMHIDGKHVAPGFIDLHGHVDSAIVRSPLCHNFLLMGVTTLITGNCGSSMQDLDAHFGRLDRGGIGINYGSLVGHGTVRRAVLGTADRAPNAAELKRMQDLVETGMTAGAFGLSTGLIYVPGTYAKRSEIGALAAVAGRFGGLYVSHMRNENDRMRAAIEEALAIGEIGGCAVHISHIKCSGKNNHGRAGEMIAMLRAARSRGVRVSADQYAYDASSTGIDVLFPTKELAIGREAFAKKLQDDEAYRAQIKQSLLDKMDKVGFGDFRYARVASARKNADLNGLLLPEAAQRRYGDDGREAQAELAMALLIAAAPQRVTMVYHTMNQQDVDEYMSQDWIAVASDAGIRALDSTSRPHPRGSGNNARVLARYVRERGVIDLPTAIYKMSTLPARLFGLQDRGELRVGAFADLVVFDAKEVMDRATYQEPTTPPDGIICVLVNGRIAASNGTTTGVRAGRVLRHRNGSAPK